MARLLPVPSPGHIARVRQRLYLVDDVVAPPMAGESTLVRLSCIDDDNQGQPLEVLWERELDPTILTGEAWASIAQRGFDQPTLFAAYLYTFRWNCMTAMDPWLVSHRLLIDEAYAGPLRMNGLTELRIASQLKFGTDWLHIVP